jgi:SAM-dependent methyltransferase
VAGLSRLRLFYLLHLSKPASDRLVFREIRRLKSRKVVEIGLGPGQRAIHIIELLREFHEVRDIHYTGIDLFEARTAADGPGISLREAHCLLKATGARIQLVPGSVGEALSRIANGVSQVDVVVISAGIRPEQLSQAWFFLPRMIHAQTRVFQETVTAGGNTGIRLLEAREVEQLAAQGQRRVA